MEQTSGEENAVLSIPVSKRSDTGKYTINLSNKFGEDSGDLKIIVLGAFEVSDMYTAVFADWYTYARTHSCTCIHCDCHSHVCKANLSPTEPFGCVFQAVVI